MTMSELRLELAAHAQTNAAFVQVLAALCEQQPGRKLVVKREWMGGLAGTTRLSSRTDPETGAIVFENVSKVKILEGPIHEQEGN